MTFSYGLYHIGFRTGERGWVSVNGREVNTNTFGFDLGQPNGEINGEDVAVLYVPSHCMHDYPASIRLPFICEYRIGKCLLLFSCGRNQDRNMYLILTTVEICLKAVMLYNIAGCFSLF